MQLSRFDIVAIQHEAEELPCVVISPNEMNAHLPHIIVAPLHEHAINYPTRIGGHIALEELRTVDKSAVTRKIGRIKDATKRDICAVLEEMFRY